jgi:hypothetical protein
MFNLFIASYGFPLGLFIFFIGLIAFKSISRQKEN